jgi:hypothetical protein
MRYINDQQTSIEAANNPDPTKRDHYVFGAGRRRCQGMHIADRSLFLAIARLLWAFNFDRVVSAESGKPIIPDAEDITEGIMSIPSPFPVHIVPQSTKRAEAVAAAWSQATDLLDEHGQWKVVPEDLLWTIPES